MISQDAVDQLAMAHCILGLEVHVVPALEQVHQCDDHKAQGIKELNIEQYEAEKVL
jgi:hypothetical protein